MNYSRFALLAALLALAACKPKGDEAAGAAPADSKPPVAVVNGDKISATFFDVYTKAVSGKLDRYGDAFLEVIAGWQDG